MVKVAINGFGRIGRNVLRAMYEYNTHEQLQVVAINDLGEAAINAHLLKYDTVHGEFAKDVSVDGDSLVVAGDRIKVLSERNPADLPWKEMGVDLPFENYVWYGEDDDSVRDEFYHQARLMDLDAYTVKGSSEPLTQRLWRRYGGIALELLEDIRQNPKQAERLMKDAEYLRCEIEHTARYEMVTKLDDFLRRRSKITQVVRHEDIINAPGLIEACEIFFGDEAQAKRQEYIDSQGS